MRYGSRYGEDAAKMQTLSETKVYKLTMPKNASRIPTINCYVCGNLCKSPIHGRTQNSERVWICRKKTCAADVRTIA
jgi:hypothetical protein